MSEKPELFQFKDPNHLLAFMDGTFARLAGELEDVLASGMDNTQDSESHLLMPVEFAPEVWTKLVWAHWTSIEEDNIERMEAGEDPEDGGVVDIMTTYFNGLAEAVADGAFSPEQGSTLPMNAEQPETFDYYDGFEKLDGWNKLIREIEAYGLDCKPFLAPMEDGKFGIGLVIHSGTTQPLMDFIRSGKVTPSADGPHYVS